MNRFFHLLCYFAAAAIVAGCAAPGTSPVAAKASVPDAWTQPVPAGPTAQDLRTWWKSFNDPTLDALVQEALERNLDLAQATSRFREARLQSGRAAVQFRPSLAANAVTLQDISATDSYFHASIDMVWELGLFGAAESIRDMAQADAGVAAADLQGVRVAVVADVVRNYLDLRAAQRQLQWLDKIAAIDERTAALAQVRVRTHLGVSEDIFQARIRAAQSRAAQALPREAGARAAQALAVLLGRTSPDAAWSAAPATGVAPGAFTLTELPADLLRRRPDVRAAEFEVQKAAGALGLARSELYPRVAIMGSLLYSYNLTHNRRTTDDMVPAVGPTIDIPLFDWGRRNMQVCARQEALNASLVGYQRAVNNGIQEAEGALAALAAQQSRADALGQVLSLVRERVAMGQTQSRLGLMSEYDGLAQRRLELQSQSDLATAQDARALAFVALYKALGGAPLAADESAGAAP